MKSVYLILIFIFSLSGRGEQTGKSANRKIIRLPAPVKQGPVSLEKAISARRSVRSYSSQKVSDQAISQLLWAGQGITEPVRGLRAAPSAGATYPLQLYVLTAEGLSRYLPVSHELMTLGQKDLRPQLASFAFGQPWIKTAPLILIMTATPSVTTARYGEPGEKYVLIEAGHAAQNIHLQAVALGLGSVPVGAFDSSRVSFLLGLPKKEVPIYLIPVGHPFPE